ncbi:PREDICTED: uncharacterized protein LOC105559283, partial [Vollenhovia emeryi]|uniref:uncharacterized protein LOC105559283 n=1 Tax=Vollenhovia emeryi TaxID=411798 RepID=UPI0005F40C3C
DTKWPHVQGLALADPQYLDNDPIELLLGAEVCSTILQEGLRRGGPQSPIAQKTVFGWILSGGCSAESLHGRPSSLHCAADHDLIQLVQTFWEQEREPSPPPLLSPDKEMCETLFTRTVSRTSSGRYVVRLPAERLLAAMERKFTRDGRFRELYTAFMQEFLELQHMSAVHPSDKGQARCYLPHHGVLRDGQPDKLRVVFNGSQRTRSGESLNTKLLVGANLLPSLADVLLRWRWHRFAFVTDIEKMYRQILIHPEDRDHQRVLWRADRKGDVQEFRLNTVTYGLACAPFLTIRTLHQLAEDEGARHPRGAAALRHDCYVDDIVTGAHSLHDAIALQTELRELCTAGGFPLRKWAASHSEILRGVPPNHRLQTPPHSWNNQGHATLGLRWHPKNDQFSFVIRPLTEVALTKRRVLAETARLFDPLGWLAPVIIRAKILIQSAWLQRIDWDTPLPADDVLRWKGLLDELPLFDQIRVNRWLGCDSEDSQLEMHGFADASERGYAAVVYLRSSISNVPSLHLLAAKSRVAPVKQVSVPRLELCAAALLANLAQHLRSTLDLGATPVYLWSDSSVTLHWIQG